LDFIDGAENNPGELAEADDDFVKGDGSGAGEEEEEGNPKRCGDDGAEKASHWGTPEKIKGDKLGSDRR
jgi:hypothetical protein